MLFFRFSVMALIAFGSMVSGRFLARGFLENRGLKTESWTEDVFQRDILDETASAITSDGTTRDPQNNIKGDVDDTQLETPKEIALGTLSDGTTGDQKNEVGGVVDDFEGDTQMDVSNENPSYYDGAYRLASEEYVKMAPFWGFYPVNKKFSHHHISSQSFDSRSYGLIVSK